MSKKKILLVGSGTGGHFYPLIAIAEALRDFDDSITLYFAGPDQYDAETLNATGIQYTYIPAGKRRRYHSIRNFFDLFVTAFGVFIALIKLYVIYPDVVVSKGGYTSVPVVVAALLLKIPVVAHESDSKIGAANNMILRYAREVVVSYEEAFTEARAKNSRVHLLGIPTRKVLLTPPTQNAISTFGVDPNRPLILVIGGSQGAERINQFILDSLDELLPDYTVIHQTGENNFKAAASAADQFIINPELKKHYKPIAFLNAVELNNAYHLAHIVITRAGSSSIYEIALHGKPSIVIPIPETISHDQRTNAYAYARTGASVVLEEENMSDNLLRSEIDRIMNDSSLYNGMSEAAKAFGKSDAAEETRNLVINIAQSH